MRALYENLSALEVHFLDKTTRVFTNSEWAYSADYIIVCQDTIKTILPMKDVDYLVYPYETQ